MTFRILFISCILGIIIFLGIIILSVVSKEDQPTAPTPTGTITQTRGLIPTTEQKQKTPDIQYSQDGTDVLIETAKNRPTPSIPSDREVRATLVASVNGASGIVYQSPLVKISYVKTPDDFESEIFGDNIAASKEDAVTWLKSKGLTEEGICKLPIFFYLSPQTRSEIKKTGETFNPIPDFCL